MEGAKVQGTDAYKATGCFSVAADRISYTYSLKGVLEVLNDAVILLGIRFWEPDIRTLHPD